MYLNIFYIIYNIFNKINIQIIFYIIINKITTFFDVNNIEKKILKILNNLNVT